MEEQRQRQDTGSKPEGTAITEESSALQATTTVTTDTAGAESLMNAMYPSVSSFSNCGIQT